MTRTAFDGRTWENHIQKNVRWHWYGVWLGIGPKPLGILALGCPATSWLLVAFPEILAKLGFIIPYNHAETTTAVSPKRSSDASSMLNIVKPHLFVTNSSILQPEISDFFFAMTVILTNPINLRPWGPPLDVELPQDEDEPAERPRRLEEQWRSEKKWLKKPKKTSSVKAIQPNYINVLIWARKPLTKSNWHPKHADGVDTICRPKL